jgi:hypothetical protein
MIRYNTDGEVVIMLAFQASGTGSIPVRCNDFLYFLCHLAARCLCHFAHLLSVHETPMKQPLPKRRRVSSNPLTLFSSSGTLGASPKPSKISTCTSCHRAIGLKSSPAFLCTRSAAYCHSKAFLSPYSGNTTDVAHHHVLFA